MTSPRMLPVLLVILVSACQGVLRMPSYIKACSRNDPKLNECAIKAGREAIPKFINGDRKYRIPNLNPLRIESLKVDDGSGPLGLAFDATNADIYGLPDAHIDDIRIDLDKRHVEYDLSMPRLEMLTTYNVSGRVLLLPIMGNGQGNITLVGMKVSYIYDFDWVLRKEKEGNFTYGIPKTHKLLYNLTRAYLHLDNLFNGDKLLGDTTNRVLNENWQDLSVQVGPTIAEAVGEVMRQILASIFDLVPVEYAFPESKPK